MYIAIKKLVAIFLLILKPYNMKILLIYSIVMWFISMIVYSHAVRNDEALTPFERWAVIMAPITIPIYIGCFIIEEL